MPYIKPEEREIILSVTVPQNEGQLNFIISTICKRVLDNWDESYTTYNALIGVLESVKLELYRRKVSKYEDKKIKENGDVY